MVFKIVCSDTKSDYTEFGELVLFKTGKEAAQKIERLNNNYYNHKYTVKPYTPPSNDWKIREQGRFDSGEYVRLPPEIEKYCLTDHFVHVALKTPERISYTASPEKGAEDRQTLSSIRGYLERFAPILNREEREELEDLYTDKFASYELKWAVSADEIEKVYTNYDRNEAGVAASCMRYEIDEDNEGEFMSPIHPVRVYGDSDLQLAFITNTYGETAARALVWTEKKIYSRVYGGNNSGNKLHRLLKKNGFKKSSGYYDDTDASPDTFHGALIQAIPYDGKNNVNAHIMPYIDEVSEVALEPIDGKDWFRLGSIGFTCQCTNGLTHDEEELQGICCDCCGNYDDGEELSIVNYDRWYSTQRFCPTCVQNHTFECQGYNDLYHTDNFDSCEVDGLVYSESYAQQNFIFCPECETYHKEDLVSVEIDDDVQEMCITCQADNYPEYELDEASGKYIKPLTSEEDKIVMKIIKTSSPKKKAKSDSRGNVTLSDMCHYIVINPYAGSITPTPTPTTPISQTFSVALLHSDF